MGRDFNLAKQSAVEQSGLNQVRQPKVETPNLSTEGRCACERRSADQNFERQGWASLTGHLGLRAVVADPHDSRTDFACRRGTKCECSVSSSRIRRTYADTVAILNRHGMEQNLKRLCAAGDGRLTSLGSHIRDEALFRAAASAQTPCGYRRRC